MVGVTLLYQYCIKQMCHSYLNDFEWDVDHPHFRTKPHVLPNPILAITRMKLFLKKQKIGWISHDEFLAFGSKPRVYLCTRVFLDFEFGGTIHCRQHRV